MSFVIVPYLALACGLLMLVLWRVVDDRVLRRSAGRDWSKPRDTAQDRGSSRGVHVAFFLSIGVTLVTWYLGLGALPWYVLPLGLALMAIGLIVRGWALATLGRHFSVRVKTTADQEIIQAGPYRLVRHPAYTEFLLIFIGFPVVLLLGFGLIVSLVAFGAAVGYRIHIEEQALVARFGPSYEAYRRSTWRLIPYVV